MEIKFQREELRMLFEDIFFKDNTIGTKAVNRYRIIVNLILSAANKGDLENMRFLHLKTPGGDIPHHTADIAEKRILIMNLTDAAAEIIDIRNKETE